MTSNATLLIEIGTEELPPTQIRGLSTAFCNSIKEQLDNLGFSYGHSRRIATPRRLGIILKQVPHLQPNRTIERRGPQISAAFDAEGKPTKAALGFASSLNVSIDDCETVDTDKGSWLVYQKQEEGKTLAELLQSIIETAIKDLPMAKKMRWGNKEYSFVRPIQWLVTLHGEKTLPVKLFDIRSSRQTYGHRFLCPDPITLAHPDEYREKLYESHVIISYKERRDLIEEDLKKAAAQLNGQAIIREALLDEVAGLVEWPIVHIAQFDKSFLSVPPEAIISVMENHQRYFPVTDKEGKLKPNFLLVTHTPCHDPIHILTGNQRVIRARLSDAQFFFETDKKTKLSDRIDALKNIVFQQKLGTVYDKTLRVQKLGLTIAQLAWPNQTDKAKNIEKASLLSKTDLLTNMVGEFPELQGTMGRYYATLEGESTEVADALYEAYLPKFSGDHLPKTHTGTVLALSDRLDTMVGLFGIGQPPTGTKDPFALRRAALGILRILVENNYMRLDLKDLINASMQSFEPKFKPEITEQVFLFIMERFKAKYQDEGISPQVVDAVTSLSPTIPYDFNKRVHAVDHFIKLSEAEALAAANKRVSNILKKEPTYQQSFDKNLLQIDAEKVLSENIDALVSKTAPLIADQSYTEALTQMASLKDSVDKFFEDVMVNVEDEKIKANRILLLHRLQDLFLQVADISKLS